MMNPVLDYFQKSIKEKELFNEILNLRNVVLKMESEINLMKESQMKMFKQKYHNLKMGTARESIHYDLMYAAMFGNHVVI
jgi:hypothetical protein